MKTFAFLAGNKADPSSEIQIQVDRTAAPAAAQVGLWLDDDGKLFPQVKRLPPVVPAVGPGLAFGAEFVLLDRARIRTTVGALEGELTLEPGTKFDLQASPGNRILKTEGGEVTTLAGRRFLAVTQQLGLVHMDKRPNEVKVFTLQWEAPPGAATGERYPVHVVQKNAKGAVVGGITVEFVVD